MTSFIIGIITIVAIYCILVLALNIRWGYCGLLDFGVAGFFLIGAYTSAILISAPSESYLFGVRYTVGYGLSWPIGLIAAAVTSGFLAFLIGIPTLRLRGDYLAIVTIGVAEILRYVAINEKWLTRGVQGIRNIARPFESSFPAASLASDIIMLALTLSILALFFIIASRLYISPFGRVLRAIREDEVVTSFLGKTVFNFKMLTFVLGGIYMGVAGALFAIYTTAIEPYQFIPTYTFLMEGREQARRRRGAFFIRKLLIGGYLAKLSKEFFWESLRDSIVPAGRLRSFVVKGFLADASESDVEPLGQLAGSLEELELNTL